MSKFKDCSIKEIKEAIMKFAADPEFCKKCGQNGRALYDSKYSWIQMQDRIRDLYQEVMSQ